jgi:small subunit ribosomal protein S24e
MRSRLDKMDVKIIKKEKNSLLQRTEVSGAITFEGATPSNLDLAQKLDENINLVVVKNIYTSFGLQEATFKAVIYDSQEAKLKVEKETKHMKKQVGETAKMAEEKKKAEEEETAEKASDTKEEMSTEESKSDEPKTEKVKEAKEPMAKVPEESSKEAEA